ncbi:MAG: L-serine ammonia-lyase, iron-sulfur-dependent subunit beta [Defluviitaleaceae bacterium]|nr:L-serine ammonia-lyase, iron-sulfur-dependent subunit beta [Defluviitaleaceae bacterium]
MNIFDIIGPIMVGPSSSHTAGALHIGFIARLVLKQMPSRAVIKFHGSFAQTYKGHGSDKAVVGGLLGYKPDDARIRTSLEDAVVEGMSYTFHTVDIPGAHPNTIVIEAETAEGLNTSVVGASIGGGNVIIRSLNGIEIEYTGNLDTMVVEQRDVPGVINSITGLLAAEGINIANMRVFQSKKEVGKAVTIIETETDLNREIALAAQDLDNIITSIYLPKIS